jgi:hypothetical protein
MHEKPPWIGSPCQDVSNGRWNSTWFLTVEKLCPLKNEAPKYGQEAPDLRSRSYKLALKSSKGETLLKTKSHRLAQRSSKQVTWKGINTHEEYLI